MATRDKLLLPVLVV